MNELNPVTQNFVTKYNLEGYIADNSELLTTKKSNAMGIASDLIDFVPVSERIKRCFLMGYDRTIKSDGEYYGTGNGISTYYDGYIIQAAIKFADRYLNGEKRVEIGMKYAEFNLNRFKKLFPIGDAVRTLNYVSSISGEEYFYDVFTDAQGNVFTFEPDAIGVGGYSGAVFVNETEALKFLDFLLGSKKHYVKDLDIGFNGLGGWNIEEVDLKLSA